MAAVAWHCEAVRRAKRRPRGREAYRDKVEEEHVCPRDVRAEVDAHRDEKHVCNLRAGIQRSAVFAHASPLPSRFSIRRRVQVLNQVSSVLVCESSSLARSAGDSDADSAG
eukprot:2860288-Rhodomonas_salina.2